jgi:hypothetical protein
MAIMFFVPFFRMVNNTVIIIIPNFPGTLFTFFIYHTFIVNNNTNIQKKYQYTKFFILLEYLLIKFRDENKKKW